MKLRPSHNAENVDESRVPKGWRLVRLRAGSVVLRFEPPLICDCGGEVEVMDWKRACEAGRYEAWCNKCQECDANGWATQAEVLQNSPGYFQKANDKIQP